jgi:hypothetical protein
VPTCASAATSGRITTGHLLPERPAHPVADSIPEVPEPEPLTPALHERDIENRVPIFSWRGFWVGFVGTFLVVVLYVAFTPDSMDNSLGSLLVLCTFVGVALGVLGPFLVALRELVVGEEEPPNPALRALQEEDEEEDIFDEDYGHWEEESGAFTQLDHPPEPADDWYDALRNPTQAIKRSSAEVTEGPPRRGDDQLAQEEQED